MVKFLQDVRRRRLDPLITFFINKPFVLFGLALSISAVCKLTALNSRELWLDETYSAFMANLPFAELLRHSAGEYNPPFYYFFLWAWVRAVGDAQTQLRLLGVVLNLCSVVGMYLLARQTLGARFGSLAAALFAFSPMLFVYSLEVRNYMLTILVFICLLMTHWAVAVEQREERWLIAAYGGLAALLFYVSYIAIFLLLGLCIHWMITCGFVRSRIVKLCTVTVLIILFISPGIPALLHRHTLKMQLGQELEVSHQNPNALSFGSTGHDSTEPAGIKAVAKNVASMAGFYPAQSFLLLALCALPLSIALAAIVYFGIVKGDELCRLFVVVALVLGIGLFTQHLAATRYLLPLVPLLVLSVGRALQHWSAMPIWRPYSLAAGALILCLYATGFFRQAFMPHGRPWQNLVNALQLQQNYHSGDTVVFDALYAQVPFDYFARQAHFHPQETGFPISIYDWWGKQSNQAWGGGVILRSDLDEFVSGLAASRPRTVWLVLYETYYYDPHEALVEKLRPLGQVTEFPLSTNPNAHGSEENSPLRLVRVTMNDSFPP